MVTVWCRRKGMNQSKGLIEVVGKWGRNKVLGKILKETKRVGIERPAGQLVLERHLNIKGEKFRAFTVHELCILSDIKGKIKCWE